MSSLPMMESISTLFILPTTEQLWRILCGLYVFRKMAGCPKKYHNNINVDSFIKQADEFERNCSGTLNSLIEKFSVRAGSMPWLVVRVRELLDWYNSGEYQKIIDNA